MTLSEYPTDSILESIRLESLDAELDYFETLAEARRFAEGWQSYATSLVDHLSLEDSYV